ncbi:hypothetical protein D3C87_1459880 [compost metagenome]
MRRAALIKNVFDIGFILTPYIQLSTDRDELRNFKLARQNIEASLRVGFGNECGVFIKVTLAGLEGFEVMQCRLQQREGSATYIASAHARRDTEKLVIYRVIESHPGFLDIQVYTRFGQGRGQ